MTALERFPSPFMMKKIKEACHQFKTKLLVGIGGAGRSMHLPGVSESARKRKRFAKEVSTLIEREGLDGVDINWETPQGSMPTYVLEVGTVRSIIQVYLRQSVVVARTEAVG